MMRALSQDVTNVTKGLHRGLRTGLRVGWKKGGKPVLSKFVRLPFRDEAAKLITSLWQRGAVSGRDLMLIAARAEIVSAPLPCRRPATQQQQRGSIFADWRDR